MIRAPHSIEMSALAEALECDPARGLTGIEAGVRRTRFGSNELAQKERRTAFDIFFGQLREFMVWVLIAAAGISFFLHEVTDAAVILVIVLLNTLLGFWQEFKAEKALSALKKMAAPNVRAVRDGRETAIPAKELVPGDLLVIQEGDTVAADARLLDASNLKVEESALTGESHPVDKDAAAVLPGQTALADRKNMIHMGTRVTYGRGKAVVVRTGMKTELGHIATLLEKVEDEKTPLQKRLAKLGMQLTVAAFVLIGFVALLNRLQGAPLKETLLTAISMAVAAIPEGLPAVVTIALALGARRMLNRKALIRNLPAVETLGSVTVICSDKTGTLTQNRMTVTQSVPDGETAVDETDASDEKSTPSRTRLLICGALCNDASLGESAGGAPPPVMGDPTEGALLVAARKAGLAKGELENLLPRTAEWPFDSVRKRMTTVHRIPEQRTGLLESLDPLLVPETGGDNPLEIALTKGAVDGLVDRVSRRLEAGRLVPFDESFRRQVLEHNRRLAENGMRVLACAARRLEPGPRPPRERWEDNQVFLGLVGMRDPVRPEAISAVASCRAAGIRVIMITGDHPLTARTVAAELGIGGENPALTGNELDRLSADALSAHLERVSVFARVSPEHKLKLIDALQEQKHIVAMTGDGVNDAPALKSADIGVAMGVTGTDVSRESADMVLVDDNFATIVAAVREGRVIFDNIRKFVKYILTGNTGEIFVMLAGPVLGMPVPLLPIQILWINLVTDGVPAVAMGYEEAEDDVMNRAPFPPSEGIFSRGTGREILVMGTLVGLVSITAGWFGFRDRVDPTVWRTQVFTTLTFCQMAYALCVRKNLESFFTSAPRPRGNPLMLPAVFATLCAQLALLYLPFFNRVFKTAPLSFPQILVCFLASLSVILVSEIRKALLRKKTAG